MKGERATLYYANETECKADARILAMHHRRNHTYQNIHGEWVLTFILRKYETVSGRVALMGLKGKPA